MPTIRQFLDLSTGHLTERSRTWLTSVLASGGSVCGGNMPYGFFVWADDAAKLADSWHPDEAARPEDWPSDLWRCMAYARAHGCCYILFDADTPADDNLPYFEDGEEAEWTDAHKSAAAAEGWAIEHGEGEMWEVKGVDGSAFAVGGDLQAYQHLTVRAADGSDLHLTALRLHGTFCPGAVA